MGTHFQEINVTIPLVAVDQDRWEWVFCGGRAYIWWFGQAVEADDDWNVWHVFEFRHRDQQVHWVRSVQWWGRYET